MEIRGKRALVTGATGFIGSHLAKRLVAEGVQVRALVRQPEKGRQLAGRGIEPVQGDITVPATLAPAMQDCHIVFHAAAWVGEGGSKANVWTVNVEGTQNVVEAAAAAGVVRFIHLSSCAVYGSLQKFNVDETTPTRKRGNLYGDSKVAAEEVVFRAYREHGLPVVVARASQVYGPGSYQFTIRPVELIKSGKMVLIDGGRYLCKPIFIDNLVDGLILCAQSEAAIGEAFNLADDTPIPWRDFFGAYGRMLNTPSFPAVPFALAWLVALYHEIRAAIKGQKASLNRGAVKALRSSNSFSNQKARQLLGWEPRVDFSEGMQLTQAWLRAKGYLNRID